MNAIKKLLAALLLIIGLGSSTASAQDFWVGSVFNDDVGFVPNVMGFDWASSGSGSAQGLGPAGTLVPVGTQFTFRYQSALFDLTDPNGQSINFPGLNTNFEYTVVAIVPEQILASQPSGSLIIQSFKTLAGGQFFIYHDSIQNADVPSGFGFDDGNLVASGTIDPDQISTFTFNAATNQGIGSAILTGKVTFADPLYLDPAITIVDFRFESTLNYPPLDSTTSNFFDGRAGEGNLPLYPVANNDLLLKVDGSSKFSVAPCIEIEKEISLNANGPWKKSETATAPSGAWYRLTVKNCGTIDLVNVVVTDPDLGVNHVIGNLAAGATVVLTAGQIPALHPNPRCSEPGQFPNTANVTGEDANGNPVSAQSSATLICSPPPCIDIKKQISVDGGPWLDADTVGTAPSVTAPHGALYRLIITNCGSVDLTNVAVSDLTLGIVNFIIGNLAAGASIIVDSGTIPSLNQPSRCENPGSFENIASVQGTDPTGAVVGPVSNPAWLVCLATPAISVDKSCTDAPGPGQPISFSATVTNTGNEALNGITCADVPATALAGVPASLAPGAFAIVTGSYIPSTSPSTDTLTCSGTGAISGTTVSHSDSATCNINVAPAIRVDKSCTDAPGPGQPISFSATVSNTGTETLNGITCADVPATALAGVPASLAPGAFAIVTGSYIPSTSPSIDTLTCSGTGAISGTTVSHSDSATCNIVVKTDMKLAKWCFDAPAPGKPITFIALMSNTGNETLNSISCADNPPAALAGVPATLAPGAWAVITGSYIPSTSPSTDTLTCSGTGAISGTTITRSSSATCNTPSTTTTTTKPTTTTTTKPTTTTTTKPTTTTTTKPTTTTTTKPTTTTTTKPTTTTTTKPPTCPGTGTPGYWKSHPEAWPVNYITVGGVTYSKSQAIYWMSKSDGDKTITMFRSLVAAKLNVLIGNDASCIASTISSADYWLKTYKLGSNVSASSKAWKTGEPLYLMLDKYNNGLLCCPSRG